MLSDSGHDGSRQYHVLHITDTLGMGGAGRVVVELLRNMDKAEFVPLVCGLRKDAWFADSFAEMGVAVELMNGTLFNLPSVARKVCRIGHQFQPDIVHAHLEASKAVGWFASRWHPKCAFVVHEHTEPQGNKYPLWMQRPFARKADLILAVSEAVAGGMRRAYRVPDDRVQVFPNGVAIEQVDAEPPVNLAQELSLPPDSCLVGFAGRLAKNKNIPLLLSAWPTILAKHPQAVLVLIGDGPERDALGAIAKRLGIAHSVCFLGQRRDVFGILKSLHVYVQPTKAEGLPLSVLEAMACRLPVVATDVGGTTEVVVDGKTGTVLPPGDAAMLADAITRYLDDKTARELAGEAGRSLVEQQYNWRTQAKELETIYRGLCRE